MLPRILEWFRPEEQGSWLWGGRILMILWGDFQGSNLDIRGNIEAGVEQDLLEMIQSEWLHSSPHHISLGTRFYRCVVIYINFLHSPPRFLVSGKLKGHLKNIGSLSSLNTWKGTISIYVG